MPGATETPVTNLPVHSDPAMAAGKAVLMHGPSGDAIAFDASMLISAAKDLSMYTPGGTSLTARETANCYVVRTPGLYKFPLVYGNGIKGGEANERAYTRQGSTYTADFVNHLGAPITSPYIEKNANCVANSVELLWQTGTGLITSVDLVEGGDCRYLQFNVATVPSTNGNAVLVVKDSSGRIMWSWHIWLTSDSLGPEDFKNHTDVDYYLMSENLGAMWNSDRTRQFNPHFQWGRKDPFVPPAAYSSSSNMTVYDINGNAITWAGSATLGTSKIGVFGTDGDQSADKTVANAIRNPGIFFPRYDTTNHNWNNLAWFNNFWNAAITGSGDLGDNQDSAVKTIYDPSPAGWMLPSGRAFTGFTTTGDNSSDSATFNVIGAWKNGWQFKRKSDDAAGNFFPASGYRAYDSGGLTDVSSIGSYWSFAPGSQTYARCLVFSSGNVGPLDYNYRAYGFSVRPSRELS